MRSPFLLSVAATAFLALQSCAATQTPIHNEPDVAKLIERHEIQMVEYAYVDNALRQVNKPLIIDARPEKKYLLSHLPTAILIPASKFDDHVHKLDDVDKTGSIITYCGGFSCTKSFEVAALLKQKGYTDVKVFAGGMPEWSIHNYAEIETEAVFGAYKKNSALLIDARPYKKYLAETIPGSLSIPNTKMDELGGRFPTDTKTPIITFCGGYHCDKSHSVADALIAKGYANVKVYAAGMPAWKKANHPTTGQKAKADEPSEEKAPAREMTHGIMPGIDEGTVDGEWFAARINDLPDNVVLIDVRPKASYDAGHFNGAIHLNTKGLSAQQLMKVLPKNKTVVFHCAAGAKSLEAWQTLYDAELDVSRIFYFDANIDCKGTECSVEVNEPMGF